MRRCCFPPALFCIHSWRSTGGRQQLARCPPPPGGALALASFYTGSDHHLTTPSSQLVPCAVCTSQHSFITTTNSAGSCAHHTISGAVSWYLPVCNSSPTPKARGSNPPGRTKGSTHLGATFFILYEILREAERGFEQLQRRPPPAAEAGSRSRGRGRRGQAPPKGRRPMRAPQPVQCPPPYVPAGKKAPAGLFWGAARPISPTAAQNPHASA